MVHCMICKSLLFSTSQYTSSNTRHLSCFHPFFVDLALTLEALHGVILVPSSSNSLFRCLVETCNYSLYYNLGQFSKHWQDDLQLTVLEYNICKVSTCCHTSHTFMKIIYTSHSPLYLKFFRTLTVSYRYLGVT